MKKREIKIRLDEEERRYLSGLIEAHRFKIDFLSKKQKEKKPIKNDLKIANSIDKKLTSS